MQLAPCLSRRLMQTALLGIAVIPSISSACWTDAENLYGVSAHLLYAVARAESDLKPDAVNLTHRTRTGTFDIGLMQINSGHLPRLARLGISESDLYEPCTNIKVGAWLLADSFARHGVSWEAVGAYNAACTQLKSDACAVARSRYAWRVFRRLPSATAPSGDKQAAQPIQTQAAPQVPITPFILAARATR